MAGKSWLKPKVETEEEKGIKAIIALQGMMNLGESREKAAHGWASMSDSEKKSTLEAYKVCFPKG